MRLRLTASYVAFTAVVLAGLGFFLAHFLREDAEANARAAVEADYGAALGFLHIDNQRPEWVYDQNDPDVAYAVARLQHVYQLTGPDGSILQESTIFSSFKTIRPAFNPQFAIVRDDKDVPYAVRSSWIHDDRNQRYGLAIGRSLMVPYRHADRLLESYAVLMLPILLLTGIFSWWIAGIAIKKI